jgi:homoserine dehydrogenase
VLSDIAALRYHYRYEYKKLYHHQPLELTHDFYVRAYVSFEDWANIPKEEFEWIEEWHANESRNYLVGVIHFAKLKKNTWWKENNTSLILAPQAIIESIEINNLKKRSLELAGII